MAFIVAGLIAVTTIAVCAVMIFAAGMSDSPSASADVGGDALRTFVIGIVIAGLVAASHWLPHIGW